VKTSLAQSNPGDKYQVGNDASSAGRKAVGRTNTARRNRKNQNNDTGGSYTETTEIIRTTKITLANM
jgi:hypothetical protein